MIPTPSKISSAHPGMMGPLLLVLALTPDAAQAQQSSDRGSQSVVDSSGTKPTSVASIAATRFLNSLGVNTHVSQGYNPGSYVLPLRYLGVRNIRDSPNNIPGYLMLHAQTGVRVDLLGSDLQNLIAGAKTLARAGALLSVEGPNEPNNFPVTYNGAHGGGPNETWIPVAELQRDIYAAVQTDPDLKGYPVFHVSEGGAETDNVGLQYLTVPTQTDVVFPAGTRYADYANPHNYVSGVHGGYADNQAWQAADPVLNGRWDSLYGEYGRTWKKKFAGYSNAELQNLPRVTTETGWGAANVDEERTQGVVLVNTYLSQFKRNWSYTFIYQLGEGEGGGGTQGLFHKNWTPKLAATYIHNLTSILQDTTPSAKTGELGYSISHMPDTVHDLLLQKSNGAFELVIWGEQVSGQNNIKVDFGTTQRAIYLYDVTTGHLPVQSFNDASSVSLSVTDHAYIIEIP